MITVGSQVRIPRGTSILTQSGKTTKTTNSSVTVRRVQRTRAGNTKVFWKRNGYLVSAILRQG